jgi:hypothetical protein
MTLIVRQLVTGLCLDGEIETIMNRLVIRRRVRILHLDLIYPEAGDFAWKAG